MNESRPTTASPHAVYVAAGDDRFGEQRRLDISSIAFKVVPQDRGGLFIFENIFHATGGPARHPHYAQEERFRLLQGDAVLAPRRAPHVWACVGDGRGRMLITFTPPGAMDAFFCEVTNVNAMPRRESVRRIRTERHAKAM